MILFVNACVREDSRTEWLAKKLLSEKSETVEEVRLIDVGFPKADEAFLKKRDRLISERDFGDGMFLLARRFSEADEIVIAAPCWDLSFPASLKQYLEQVNVVGITFYYTPEGVPKGLCRAKKLTYVTTVGGEYFPTEFGFGYVEALAHAFYGIEDVELVKATGLDIEGADVEAILKSAL